MTKCLCDVCGSDFNLGGSRVRIEWNNPPGNETEAGPPGSSHSREVCHACLLKYVDPKILTGTALAEYVAQFQPKK